MTPLPRDKYEGHGRPKLRKIAESLNAWDGSIFDLLRYVTFVMIVGNADLHG